MNKFNPDWDAMAVMVEEMQRMAQHIEKLEAALISGDAIKESVKMETNEVVK